MTSLRQVPGGRSDENGIAGGSDSLQDSPQYSGHLSGLGVMDARRPLTGRGPSRLGRMADQRDVAKIVAARVVPQLLAAHDNAIAPGLKLGDGSAPRRGQDAGSTISAEDIATFARRLRQGHVAEAFNLIHQLRGAGAALEDIFLDLMGPSASLLGSDWETDTLDFVDVTLGMSRMQHVLQTLMNEFEGAPRGAPLGAGAGLASGRAYIATIPGEQHSFGALMVTGFLRRYGWDVWCDVPSTDEEIIAYLALNPCDVVGLAFSRDDQVPALQALIEKIRNIFDAKDLRILVGGPALAVGSVNAADVGADGGAADARDALRLANMLIDDI